MSISGHKSEASLRSYAKTNAGIKRKMSSTISSVATCSKKRNFDFGLNLNKLNISVSEEEKEENKDNELKVALPQEVEDNSLKFDEHDEKPSVISSLFRYKYNSPIVRLIFE